MNIIDGNSLPNGYTEKFDVVIVGSGPAGASCAYYLSKAGIKVAILEEGHRVEPVQFEVNAFDAMGKYYRDMGASVLMGNCPMPFVQGRAVGGTSLINGAISWRLPENVYRDWVENDKALEEDMPYDKLTSRFEEIEKILNIHPTEKSIAGKKNLLMAKGADALGLEHRPISRNVENCEGLGRCMQGCPGGHKKSMDLSFLPMAKGAKIFSGTRAIHIITSKERARGIEAISANGSRATFSAGIVVLAASAVQTPCLLLSSSIKDAHTGRHFQCHPGVSMAAKFKDEIRAWSGATQGHEVIGLRNQGVKFEVLGYDYSILAARIKGAGREFAREVLDLKHWLNWGAAIRAEAHGRVKPGKKRASIKLHLTRRDVQKVQLGMRYLGEMMLAAGAEYVTPGIPGWHARVTDRKIMARLPEEATSRANAYTMAVTHMFSTCRMGSDPNDSVVNTKFRHHRVGGLFVADSSVFPTNTGVNPQTSIIALASFCAEHILSEEGRV